MPNQVRYNGISGLTGASAQLFNQGMTNIQGVADRYAGRVKDTQIAKLMATEQGDMTADEYHGNMRSNIAGIAGVSPLEAINLSNAASAPIFAKEARETAAINRTQDLGYKDAALVQDADKISETSRHNVAMENKVTAKGYGAITDDFGTTYIYNKDSGNYEPIVNAGAGRGGIRITSKTPKMALPDGTKVYQDGRGNPILGSDNKPIVVERSKTNLDIPTTEANFDTLISRLDEGVKTVGKNKGAVGSFGSDPIGFIANNLNDIVQMPTDDFRDRTKIKGYSNALVGTIYKMVETGVMTDADAERYLAQVPKPDDSPIVYKDKANRLREELVANRESIRKRMGIDSDYQTQENDPLTPKVVNPATKPSLKSFGF